jgi:replicative DNA helicase
MIDEAVLAWAIKYNDIYELQQAGVSVDNFVDEYRTVWKYLMRMKRDHDALPSRDTVLNRFPDINLPRVRRAELPMLLDTLRKRTKFVKFMHALNDTAGSGVDFENVDEKIQILQGQLNTLAFQSADQAHLVNLFSRETTERIRQEYKKRRSGLQPGIKTGLHRFDRENMGLQRQKMVVIMARTGIGKSWLDLLFMANAVMGGENVILYPLEMTLQETAFRLYTLFTQSMFGPTKVLKNLELTRGNIGTKKLVRVLHALEDTLPGTLHVADIGSLSDPYTVERIEAEVDVHRPGMFWVDYITLLKPPPGTQREREDIQIRQLSNGIAGIAKRRNTVGGCSAQVNREALKVKAFLPRVEHIAYGDAIGQDADQIFSLNRKGEYMYYALVKNRGGVEIPKMRVKFHPNEGIMHEDDEQGEEDDDD